MMFDPIASCSRVWVLVDAPCSAWLSTRIRHLLIQEELVLLLGEPREEAEGDDGVRSLANKIGHESGVEPRGPCLASVFLAQSIAPL